MSDASIVVINLEKDVTYEPAGSWNTTTNYPCAQGTRLDHFTMTTSASASLKFQGNRVVVTGVKKSNTGSIQFQVDGQTHITQNLQTKTAVCDTIFDFPTTFGEHNLTIVLASADAAANGGTISSVLDIVEIDYYVPTNPPPSTGAHAKHAPVGAIVGGVIGGVVILGLLVIALLWRHRARNRGLHRVDNRKSYTKEEIDPAISPLDDASPRPYPLPGNHMAEQPTETILSYGPRGNHTRLGSSEKSRVVRSDSGRRSFISIGQPATSINPPSAVSSSRPGTPTSGQAIDIETVARQVIAGLLTAHDGQQTHASAAVRPFTEDAPPVYEERPSVATPTAASPSRSATDPPLSHHRVSNPDPKHTL